MKIVEFFNVTFWRLALILLMLIASACKEGGLHAASPYTALPKDRSPFQATVTVNLAETFPTNKRLLGNNIQWVDRGDELLKKGNTDFSPVMLDKVIKLQPTVLRYPGGSLSDLYRWEHGMGSANKRRKSSRFHGDGEDTIMFGTEEFLRLCQLTGAEPLITANVITAPPEETLNWIKKINFDRVNYQGKDLPKVRFLEVGNEPYLIDDNKKELAITAKEYAKRANVLVSKLRKLDPKVEVGIPLRSDDFDGMPVTPMPGFNKDVLEGFSEKIDFVALHNTYFPFIWADLPSNHEQIYLATMAATSVVSKDLERTRQQLKMYRKEKNIPIRTQSEWAEIMYAPNRKDQSVDHDVFPSLLTDRDENGKPDGYKLKRAYWDSRRKMIVSRKNGELFSVDELAGLYKGKNLLSFGVESGSSCKIKVSIKFPGTKHQTLAKTFSIDSGKKIYFWDFTIPEDVSVANFSWRLLTQGKCGIFKISLQKK